MPARPALVTFLAVGACFGTASAQQPRWRLDAEDRGEQFGCSLTRAPDHDGDGIDDFLVGAIVVDADFEEPEARVLSGADLSLLLTLRSPDHFSYRRYGNAVAAIGDVDLDGRSDYAVANHEIGMVHLHSSRDGSVIRTISAPTTSYWDFGFELAPLGDTNADGIPDLAIGASIGPNSVARIEVRSGADGSLLHAHDSLPGFGGISWPGRFANVGDLDHDGVADLAMLDTATGQSELRIASGRTGTLFRVIQFSKGSWSQWQVSFFGTICNAGDIDGDGDPDLAIVARNSNSDTVLVLSGADGSIVGSWGSFDLWDRPVVRPAGDVDGDGAIEWVVSYVETDGGIGIHVDLFDGADGSLRLRVVDSGSLGAPLAAGFDFDQDGVPDLLVGDPAEVRSGIATGRVEVRSLRDGALVASRNGRASESSFSGGVALVGDLDGDGVPDFATAHGGETFNWHVDSAQIRSGADGSLLATHAVNRMDGDLRALPDLDGDGLDDYAVGVEVDTAARRVEVRSTASGALLGTIASAATDFGRTLAVAQQPDGSVEIAVGAPRSSSGTTTAGEVSVWNLADFTLKFTVQGQNDGELLGTSVAALGDVDGDGSSDWAAGAPLWKGGGFKHGRVVVFSGVDGHTIGDLFGGSSGDLLGQRIAAPGDLDGDGRADLLVSAPGYGGLQPGRVSAIAGGSWVELFAIDGSAADTFGFELAALGDVNGDGRDDWAATRAASLKVDVHSGANGGLLASIDLARLGLGETTRPYAAQAGLLPSLDGDDVHDLLLADGDRFALTGHLQLFSLDDLMLQVEPPVAASGDTAFAFVRGGPPHAASGLELVAVDDIPFRVMIGLGTFDVVGAWSISEVVPPGLSGMSFTLRGWGIGFGGRLMRSPDQVLEFE